MEVGGGAMGVSMGIECEQEGGSSTRRVTEIEHFHEEDLDFLARGGRGFRICRRVGCSYN